MLTRPPDCVSVRMGKGCEDILHATSEVKVIKTVQRLLVLRTKCTAATAHLVCFFRSQLEHRAVLRAGRMSQDTSSLPESQQMSPAEKALKSRASTVGQALMFVAALFWGSNPAALRYLYTSPGPPDAPVLSAAQTGLASVILIIISQCMKAARARRKMAPSREQDPPSMRTSASDTQELIAHDMPSDMHEDELESHKALKQGDETSSPKVSDTVVTRKGLPPLDHVEVEATQVALASVEDSKAPSTPDNDIEAAMGHSLSLSIDSSASDTAKTGIRYQVARLLNWSTDDVRIAGLELGLLTFTANAVTIIGFALATASRGAFLLRSSIVSTPILSTLAGISVAKAMWMGAVLGFTGSVLISTDPVDSASAPADTDSYISHVSILGDLLIVCAAVLWSGVMVRQSRHAACFPATDLAAAKLSVMACMSFLWLFADVLYKIAIGKAVVSIWAGWQNPVAWLVLLWPAIGPWSTAEIAQIEAQSRISASHGQIILAIDPLISVAFAGLVNKAEQHLGIRGWFGGALLVIACLVASRGDSMPMH